MAYLLTWLLIYPLVACVDTLARASIIGDDPSTLNIGHVVTYGAGACIFLIHSILA